MNRDHMSEDDTEHKGRMKTISPNHKEYKKFMKLKESIEKMSDDEVY